MLEAQVARLSELLANVISDTRARVEKKQAQTYEELAAEMEEAEAEAAVDDDEEVHRDVRRGMPGRAGRAPQG